MTGSTATNDIARKHGAMNHGSMTTKRFGSLRRQLAVLASAAMLASVAAVGATISTASAATDIYVCAKAGSASVANPADGGLTDVNGVTGLPFLGFTQVLVDTDCATATVQLGDPTPIRLTEGDDVNLILVNESGETINLSAAGLTGAPDVSGVLTGGQGTYSFTAGNPGTYILESDLDPRHTLLGLHAVIVVDPVGGVAGSAHGTSVSVYDNEEILVVHEVDTALQLAGAPMSFDLETYKADLHLINGQTHTTTTPITAIQAAAGDRVLVRYVNAGSNNTSMAVQGLRQNVVAFDAETQTGDGSLGETPADSSNVFLSAGQTADVILNVDGAVGDAFAIYSRNLRTSAVGNNGAQLVMLQVGAGGIAPGATIYFSLNWNRTFVGTPNLAVRDEDVAKWDGTTLSVFFDGSDHGLAGTDIYAAHVDSASGDVYFSLRQDFAVPSVSVGDWTAVGLAGVPLQEQDVYKYDDAGNAFSVWLDGSVIGLSDGRGGHDINGVQVDPVTGITSFTTNGSIALSHGVLATNDGSSLTLWSSTNEDVINWVPDAGAADPSGSGHFEYVFDGSDLFPLSLRGAQTIPRYNENLNAVVLAGSDVMFAEANSVQADLILPGSNNNDLIGCLGHVLNGGGGTTDTCVALAVQFDPDVDLPALVAGAVGQADAYSLG